MTKPEEIRSCKRCIEEVETGNHQPATWKRPELHRIAIDLSLGKNPDTMEDTGAIATMGFS